MLIDSHIHLGRTEKSKRFFTPQSCLDLMDRCEVDGAIVMPNLSNLTTFSELNSEFIGGLNGYDRLYPFLLIDCNDPEVKDQITQYRDVIKGVKFHPSISQVVLSDASMEPILDVVSELGLPVLVHCGRHRKSSICYVIETAEKYENLTFIAAHLGGNANDLIEIALRLLLQAQLDNVYLDTSACKSPWLIERAVEVLGSDKILYGSDEPYSDMRISKYCCELADLAVEVKSKIYSENVRGIIHV